VTLGFCRSDSLTTTYCVDGTNLRIADLRL